MWQEGMTNIQRAASSSSNTYQSACLSVFMSDSLSQTQAALAFGSNTVLVLMSVSLGKK